MIRRLLVAVVAAVALAGCGTSTPVFQPAASVPPVVSPTPAAVVAPAPGLPVSIEIPKLNITDDIVAVGLAKDGSMEVPPVERSGWFRLGPKPGAVGPATVIGHVDYDGVSGALGRIGELRNGDQAIVSDTSGVARVFVVYAVRAKLKKTEFATVTAPLVFGETAGPELRLVTCSGPVVAHQYQENTVVSLRLTQP